MIDKMKFDMGGAGAVLGAARALAEAGLVAEDFVSARDFLTRVLILVRLVSPDCQEPPEPVRALIAESLALADWAAVMDTLIRARGAVTGAWEAALGPRDQLKAKD